MLDILDHPDIPVLAKASWIQDEGPWTQDHGSIDIGIFALGVIPKKSKKLDRGLIGEVLVLNGIYVQQGDWVYCDKNGVIISKQEIK